MKLLNLFIISMLLTGCASQDLPLSTVEEGPTIIAVGTLADANDPYDMASAPVITKVTVTRIATANAVKRHRITFDEAKAMLSCTDAAIDAVNDAYSHKSFNGIAQSSRMADRCKADLEKFKRVKS